MFVVSQRGIRTEVRIGSRDTFCSVDSTTSQRNDGSRDGTSVSSSCGATNMPQPGRRDDVVRSRMEWCAMTGPRVVHRSGS